jgi:hypothetical protein
MNDHDDSEAVSILLSREELLFVLNLLQAEFIPGLDADPLGELTAEQQALAFTVAGRALWARELAQLQPNGEWVIHNDLLTVVGGCAYAQSIISIYHWSANAVMPRRFFGHIRGNNIVGHTRPADVLHRFSLLSSKEQLMAQVLAVCEFEDRPVSQPLELAASSADFVKVRELASAGNLTGAADVLVGNGVSSEIAQAFLATLAGAPRVSILQTLKQAGAGAAQKQDFTLMQNGQHTWLITAPLDATDGSPLSIKTTTKDEIQALLSEWLQ